MTTREDFQPKPAWRWWLHFGANETRLMYPHPPFVGIMVELSRALEETFRQIGVSLLPAFQNASKVFGDIGRYYFGEG